MNRQHFAFEKSIHLNVSNETRMERKITVKWQIRNAKAQILREEEKEILIPPLSSVWLEKEDLPKIQVFEEYVSYQAWGRRRMCFRGNCDLLIPEIFPV